MIALVLAAAVGCFIAIRPAHAHDNEQPITATGKARK